MKLSIKAAYIGACLPAVSTESTRYYLNGVHIAPAPNGEGVICVATDGHRMIFARDPDATFEGEPEILSIPKDAVKYLKDTKSRSPRLEITGKNAVIVGGENACDETLYQWQAQFIDGTFPDWRRVIPRVANDQRGWGNYNAAYLGDFCKVFAAFGEGGRNGNSLGVFAQDEQSPAIVKFGLVQDVFAVLMPMRGDTNASTPSWIDPPKAFAQAAE